MTTIVPRKRLGKPVTNEVLEEAIRLGQSRDVPGSRAEWLRIVRDGDPHGPLLEIAFPGGSRVAFPILIFPEFRDLPETELDRLTLALSGSAICLPDRDIHVSIPGLVKDSVELFEIFKAAMNEVERERPRQRG